MDLENNVCLENTYSSFMAQHKGHYLYKAFSDSLAERIGYSSIFALLYL